MNIVDNGRYNGIIHRNPGPYNNINFFLILYLFIGEPLKEGTRHD